MEGNEINRESTKGGHTFEENIISHYGDRIAGGVDPGRAG